MVEMRRPVYINKSRAATPSRVRVETRDIERSMAPAIIDKILRGVWQTRDSNDFCHQIIRTVNMPFVLQYNKFIINLTSNSNIILKIK